MSVAAHAVALTGADQVVSAGAAVYRGYSLRETAGAAATVRIYDNATTGSGTLLDTVRLSANESAREWYADGGLWAAAGIYVKVVAGAVEGSVRVG
jgi:hypothetical protein